jgi:hypothetical protein
MKRCSIISTERALPVNRKAKFFLDVPLPTIGRAVIILLEFFK